MKESSKNIFSFIKEAMKDKKINPVTFKVLVCITFLSGYKNIFPSLNYISKSTGIKSISDISEHLKKLKELNYISIQRQQRKPNLYILNLDVIRCDILQPETKKTEIETITQDTKEVLLSELNKIGFDKSHFDSLIKSNKEKIELFQKYLMLLYVIRKVLDYKPDNLKAYLIKSFKSQSYSEYHKEVFENKRIKNEIITETNRKKYNRFDRIKRSIESINKLKL